jgi:hypothetical protein
MVFMSSSREELTILSLKGMLPGWNLLHGVGTLRHCFHELLQGGVDYLVPEGNVTWVEPSAWCRDSPTLFS